MRTAVGVERRGLAAAPQSRPTPPLPGAQTAEQSTNTVAMDDQVQVPQEPRQLLLVTVPPTLEHVVSTPVEQEVVPVPRQLPVTTPEMAVIVTAMRWPVEQLNEQLPPPVERSDPHFGRFSAGSGPGAPAAKAGSSATIAIKPKMNSCLIQPSSRGHGPEARQDRWGG
jgi:hypothetical protein